MPALRAVVFDMDGLMFNTEDVYYRVGVELMRRRGRQYTKELSDAIMGRPPQACFETMIRWHGLDDDWQSLARESEELFLDFLDDTLAPMPGLLELLDALEAAGLPKAICTSSSRRLLEGILSRFSLEPRFRFTLTAEDIVHGKPHPEIYLKAAARFGIDPSEMLVLEDSQTGTRSAAAAGAFVVAVPGEHSQGHDFSAATLVASGLADPRLYAILGL
ncbi:MAG: HAD family phosphatase [Thermoguttaceae bacterium]|jgi:HAD superfamily hydrolase (TIGR01509 family)|nr:HAD family phosphatase [Thermoguttaceae bacterium]